MKKLWERLKILWVYGVLVDWSLQFVSDIQVQEMEDGQWGWVDILLLGTENRLCLLGHDRLLLNWNVNYNRKAHLVLRVHGQYYVYSRPGWKVRTDLGLVDPDNHPAWRWLPIANKPRGA